MNDQVKIRGVQQPIRGGRLPPRLIITRSKTPPKPSLPPIRIPSTSGGHLRLDTHRHISCMASVSRQLGSTFIADPTKSPSSTSGRHQTHFKCYSNPSSPNFLHPILFDFEPKHATHYDQSRQRSVSSPRPLSASRFGRQLTTPNASPTLMPITFTSDRHSKHHKHHKSSPNILSRSLSPSVVPHGVLTRLSSPSSSSNQISPNSIPLSKCQAPTSHIGHSTYLKLQDIYSDGGGGGTTTTAATIQPTSKNGQSTNATRRQQWKKYFSINRQQQQQQSSTKDTDWSQKAHIRIRNTTIAKSHLVQRNISGDGENDHRTSGIMNHNIKEGRAKHEEEQKSSQDVPESSEMEETSDYGSLEKTGPRVRGKSFSGTGTEELDNDTKEREVKMTKPDFFRYRWNLLGRSMSLDTPDASVLKCQDFGIHDYLSRTNESLDNEEESSLAGDINVGLGIQPPRFSIDSLDSHLSMLLELNETKDTFGPLNNSIGSSTSSSVQILRRHSEEAMGSSQRTVFLRDLTKNQDARNHGGEIHHSSPSSSCSSSSSSMESVSSKSSSTPRLLKKSSSLPHTMATRTLPKIQEGACTLVGTKIPLVQEFAGAKIDDPEVEKVNIEEREQRVIFNLSRNMGTFDDFQDDEEWTVDEYPITISEEVVKEDES